MIYTTGTIAVSGNTLTGTGTNFTAAGSLIRVGCTVLAMTSPPQAFQITGITSGTVMTVSPAASPALAAGTKYSILLSDSLSVDGLAQDIAEVVKTYQSNFSGFADVMNSAGDVTITINGVSVTVPGQKSLAKKGANSDITSLTGLKTALSIAQGGTGATTAAGIRTNAGLKSAATMDATTSRTDTTIGRVLQVGDFGLGGSGKDGYLHQSNKEMMRDLHNNIGGLCTFREGGAALTYLGQYNPVLFFRVGDASVAMSVAYSSGLVRIVSGTTSMINGDTIEVNTNVLYGTGNTTKTTDGTLKSASPVVKVFHDGQAETNDESEGCVVTRLDVGQYLIENCIGLNADAAWGGINGGFDIPKDRNGQALIWLDYEVNADGSVLVQTYHRTYPDAPEFAQNIMVGIADGEPVDIPVDQFVSVRVEMPQDSIWNQKMAIAQAESEAHQSQSKSQAQAQAQAQAQEE